MIYFSDKPISCDRSEEDDPNAAIARRNQTTAVILCGVIGALFDLEQEAAGKNTLLFAFQSR